MHHVYFLFKSIKEFNFATQHKIQSDMNVDFITAIKIYFANYANFKGRSTRAEYWWAMLFVFLVSLVVSIFKCQWLNMVITLALLLPNLAVLTRRFHDIGKSGWWVVGLYAVGLIGSGCLIGALGFSVLTAGANTDPVALAQNMQSHLGLLSAGYILALGAGIAMIVMCCKRSAPDNQYGPNPYGEEA